MFMTPFPSPTMKRRLLCLLAVPFVLSHCTPLDESGGAGSTGPASTGLPPGHEPYDGPHGSTYDLGMQHGRADGASGKSRQPSRHYGTFPATQTDAFNRGYQAAYTMATRPGGTTAPPASAPLTPVKGSGTVTLREGSRTVAVCATAMPNVETVRFVNGQQQIAVKSRAAHGPATVQLFNTRTGVEEGRVMAYEIRGGQPAWAAGMGE